MSFCIITGDRRKNINEKKWEIKGEKDIKIKTRERERERDGENEVLQ